MRLYHGSLERVEIPRIMPRDFYRPLDFGSGFYTTTDLEQAKRWVVNRLSHSKKSGSGFVSVFDLDEEKLAELSVKRFSGVCEEWFRFIVSNRLQNNEEHGYDIVSGPIADDRVYTVLSLYEGGFYDEKAAMEKMKAYRLADQYLFHSECSLSALRYITCLEVGA